MTLATTTSRVGYPGAGSVGPFPVPFRLQSAADLRVVVRDADDVETTLLLNTDYTIAGVGDAAATVTLTTALAVGKTLSLRRTPALTQPTSIQNQGSYFPKTHEDVFDRLVMQLLSLQDTADRSFGVSETHDPAILSLRVKPETGKVLAWQSATELGNSALDSSAIALPGAGRTVATLSAYLLNNAVANVKDYGALGDGVTDDAAAFQAALDSGLRCVYVPATAASYKIMTTLTLPSTVEIIMDAGATLQPVLGIGEQLFYRAAAAALYTKAVTSGYTFGSRSVIIADTSNLAVGQEVTFATNSAGVWPLSWNRIKTIVGTTVSFYEPFPLTYTGVVTMSVVSLAGSIRISGGVMDLSNVGGITTPALFALAGYRSAEVEGVTFRGPMVSLTAIGLVAIQNCKTGRIRGCHADDVVLFGQAFSVSSAKHAQVTDCVIDGDCFGVYMGRNDWELVQGINYTGRRTLNVTAYSVRCIKTEGSRHSMITDIVASDCETVIEWINSGRGVISNIFGVNIGQTAYVGQTAINLNSSTANGELNTITISNVVLERLGGIGIQIEGDGAGRISMTDIHIKSCYAYGIIANCIYFTIGNSIIEDWNTGALGNDVAAINANISAVGAGYSIHDIVFKNVTNTRRCMALRAGPQYRIWNVIPVDGNPLYDSVGPNADLSATNATALRTFLGMASPTAFVPTDGSGAALAFAAAAGRYIDLGDAIMAWTRVVYPVTADASAAEIDGLPFVSSNADITGMYASPIGFTTSNLLTQAYVKANTTKIALIKAGGVQATNADLSGKTVCVCAIYRKT